MYNWNKICGLVTIFLISSLFSLAQKVKYPLQVFLNKPLVTSAITLANNEKQDIMIAYSKNIIPQNHYTAHLGFICKKEIQFEKLTKVALRIRLGSLQQCNYLEGKR